MDNIGYLRAVLATLPKTAEEYNLNVPFWNEENELTSKNDILEDNLVINEGTIK